MRPSIQLRRPPAFYFEFPPPPEPMALPPYTGSDARTFAIPFAINPTLYQGALDYRVPITIGLTYAVTVIFWNKINRERNYKPYGFSKTQAFKAFVIAHNIFLAVFSAFTFVGMIRALAHTWPGREHHLLGKFWPGLRAANGPAGAADALCKMHGPRGFGDFVAYDPVSHSWNAHSKTTSLAAGLPDPSDVGRLWNEGLAFWGWWFYLSKFYEVFDTFIILSKGKRSSTLQTYHHTGAMMCMWAGIRYMSSPIWMFCFLNSGIHTMMYVYYTLSAIHIRVPQRVKRSLTTMQIGQFLIGITFATLHLFVTYTVPASVATTVSETVDNIAASAVSGVSAAVATATSEGVAAWLKQAALRAVGEEGLAENVAGRHASHGLNSHGSNSGANGYNSGRGSQNKTYAQSYETVSCIDTAGQAFAVYLNLLYLAPLTVLFMRFFVKSYLNRGSNARNPTHKRRISKSIKDAAHGTEREVEALGKKAEDGAGKVAKDLNGKVTNGNGNGKTHGTGTDSPRSRRVSSTIEKAYERFEKGEDTPESVKNGKATLRKQASAGHDKIKRMFEDGAKDFESSLEKLENAAEAGVQKVRDAVGITEEDENKDGLQESWADVHKDTYAYKEEQEASKDKENEESRSRSLAGLEQSRSTSPKKSQIPRPASTTPAERSRSPGKSTAASSLPRPSSQGPGKTLEASANGKDNHGTKPSPAPMSSPEKGEKKQKPKKLKGKNKNKDKGESSGSKENEGGGATSHSTEEGGSHTSPSTSTNVEGEQVSEPSPTMGIKEEKEGEKGESSGVDDKDLRWQHTSSEGMEGEGAERKEGLSFAGAVKEGTEMEGEGEGEEHVGNVSID